MDAIEGAPKNPTAKQRELMAQSLVGREGITIEQARAKVERLLREAK